MTMFARPAAPAAADPPPAPVPDVRPAHPVKRPPAWSLRNWPVGWKVLAIVLIPLVLATAFGALRVQGAMAASGELRQAAARADVIPAITKYMSALDVALLASSTGRDVDGAKKNYDARKHELQTRLADTKVGPDVRSGVSTLLNGGQALLDKVFTNSIGVRDRVTTYAPILLTAENVIDASVRVDDEKIRAQAQGLSRAVGARGQMTLQEILVTRGAELPEPELRTSMITLAGTEPSTLFGMAEVLGAGSPDAKTLQQQMVTRMSIMSDPNSVLVGNPDVLRSIQVTAGIAEQIIKDSTASVTKSVQGQANARRDAAIRDAILALGAVVIALTIVLLVARALVKPLRVLRDGALKVAHTDLENEIAQVRGGGPEPVPQPLAVYTTEEIGQVAHAVDELHTQALLLAGDEARLRLLVNEMFETMSRRSRSLVDQQLSLIEGLERNEEDPERLDSLFRLDHLAARLRRNSANLLVLAGAHLSRDPRQPVPLSTVLSAAVSEVEDYRRVETAGLPDCTLHSAASGSVIHLLAELIDNALRYSPPNTRVSVSAARGGDGGVLLAVSDLGLGMNESDRRIANMRLQAGGEVSPENARHMGLFVVGRLAARHGIRVGLRGPAAAEEGAGTTAEIYLPPVLLVENAPATAAPPVRRQAAPDAHPAAPYAAAPHAAAPQTAPRGGPDAFAGPAGSGSGESAPPVSLLPRRNPGSSGITDVPAVPAAPAEPPRRPRRELATPWWENGVQQEPKPDPMTQKQAPKQEPNQEPKQAPAAKRAPAQAASDTSAFFAAKPAARPVPQPQPQPQPQPDPADDDVIFQRMLSEMLGDPRELAKHPDLDWKSVWDRGWTLAAAADERPVDARTDHGLPVRKPGARLVPGTAKGRADQEPEGQDRETASNGGLHPARQPQHAPALRDPEAVRASMSSHFGGVRSGRSHARDADHDTTGPDQQ
jgi:signal transduction histidine kinase